MISRIINAINLHEGGGKTYLYLLHSFLDSKDNLLILDYRFKKNDISFKKAKVVFLQKSLLRNLKVFFIRFFNYLKYYLSLRRTNIKLKKFVEIYLNGIPPLIRFKNCDTYIFAQNRLIFETFIQKSFNLSYLRSILYIYIQKMLLKLFLRHSDTIIVQTNSMFELVSKKLRNKIILQEKIWGEFNFNKFTFIKESLINLDMSLINKIKNISSKNTLFFYPASFYNHKNHDKLIEAFNFLYKNSSKSFKLLLTLEMNELKNISKLNIKLPYILLLGKLPYSMVINLYEHIDYLVFPSFQESYGLPLIEANANNVKIIASDLDYVYEVCNPFLTFNPSAVDDIFLKIKSALDHL